jgi:hypothetical protein
VRYAIIAVAWMNGFAGTSVRLTAHAIGNPMVTLSSAVQAPRTSEFLSAWTYRRRDRASRRWSSVKPPPSVTLATTSEASGSATRMTSAIAAAASAACSARTGQPGASDTAAAAARLTAASPDPFPPEPAATLRRGSAGPQM